jgi:hypothetical protein
MFKQLSSDFAIIYNQNDFGNYFDIMRKVYDIGQYSASCEEHTRYFNRIQNNNFGGKLYAIDIDHQGTVQRIITISEHTLHVFDHGNIYIMEECLYDCLESIFSIVQFENIPENMYEFDTRNIERSIPTTLHKFNKFLNKITNAYDCSLILQCISHIYEKYNCERQITFDNLFAYFEKQPKHETCVQIVDIPLEII